MSIGARLGSSAAQGANSAAQHTHVDTHTEQCHNWRDMRLVRGGAVVTISPASNARGSGSPTSAYRIYFKQAQVGTAEFLAILQHSEPEQAMRLPEVASCRVSFDQNGDMRSIAAGQSSFGEIDLSSNPSFWMGEPGTESDALVVPLVNTNLSLDLCPIRGVIGRRASIISSGGEVLGDGVVGWN